MAVAAAELCSCCCLRTPPPGATESMAARLAPTQRAGAGFPSDIFAGHLKPLLSSLCSANSTPSPSLILGLTAQQRFRLRGAMSNVGPVAPRRTYNPEGDGGMPNRIGSKMHEQNGGLLQQQQQQERGPFPRFRVIPWEKGFANAVQLIGRVGRDIEISYLNSGRVVATTALAVHEGSQRTEDSSWFTLEIWDDLAEIAANHVAKGELIFVMGKIVVDKTVYDGSRSTNVKVVVRELSFVEPSTERRQAFGKSNDEFTVRGSSSQSRTEVASMDSSQRNWNQQQLSSEPSQDAFPGFQGQRGRGNNLVQLKLQHPQSLAEASKRRERAMMIEQNRNPSDKVVGEFEDTARGNVSTHVDLAGTTIQAIAALRNRLQQGLSIDSNTYIKVLQMCLKRKELFAAKQVHDCIIQSGMDKNIYVAGTLLNMYIKCGELQDARRVFDDLKNKSVVAWTNMISGYAKTGHAESALELFKQMRHEGVEPNEITYLTILNACTGSLALKWGNEIHECIRHAGLESDVRLGTALLQMYSKCGCIEDARQVFQKLTNRDGIAWTVMIDGLAQHGCGHEAYGLFLQMRREGFEPDVYTYLSILNAAASAGALEWVKEVHVHARKAGLESDLRVGSALVHMYAESGSIDDARQVFDRMVNRDVATWNVMIGGLAQHGCWHEAYRRFLQMSREGFAPNSFTYASLLNASGSSIALESVKEVHGHASEAGLDSNLRVGTALVHMYAESGSIDDARQVFDRMDKRDVVSCNVMISGLAQHGCGREALELFKKMNADLVKPNGTTFVAVLSACCHGGLVDEGRRLFSAMTQDYGIEPDIFHYTCMVDLLGRAGHLEEAKRFIIDMPIKPDVIIWTALLGACRTYGNVELGELAANELFKLEPTRTATFVLLSNIYAAAGKWEKVSQVRTMMQERGVRKDPGRSWIEVDKTMHEFVAQDTSHPESKAIYAELAKLTEKLKAEGYIPDTRLVLQDINEEDKELALCSHSEKLAIAYGLIHLPQEKPIHIRKNLRVCSDCHTATKLISKVTGREIIARDANRFHHFRDGVCSCGDYW